LQIRLDVSIGKKKLDRKKTKSKHWNVAQHLPVLNSDLQKSILYLSSDSFLGNVTEAFLNFICCDLTRAWKKYLCVREPRINTELIYFLRISVCLFIIVTLLRIPQLSFVPVCEYIFKIIHTSIGGNRVYFGNIAK